MMTNEMQLFPLYVELSEKIRNNDFVSNGELVEILAPKVELHPAQFFLDFIYRETDMIYFKKELKWYFSESLSINNSMDDVKIWKQVASISGEINSNYGYLVFSENNFSQFYSVLSLLKNNKDTRQAILIYQRPSIHREYNLNGMYDFICTNFQHFFIRNNSLYCITSMRSNDCWFGTFNDIPWFHLVIHLLYIELRKIYPGLLLGTHTFIPNSFHCYKAQFTSLCSMVCRFQQHIKDNNV